VRSESAAEPLQYDDRSEARNSATSAISIGCAFRRSGYAANIDACSSALGMPSMPAGRTISVSTGPGWIEFTRIPRGPSSTAAALVMPRIANLLAV